MKKDLSVQPMMENTKQHADLENINKLNLSSNVWILRSERC